MQFEILIALRYLFARKGHRFISLSSAICIAGVALGVGALILVTSVMNGFTTELRDKIIGVTAHGIISNLYTQTRESPELLQTITSVPGITAATPFIYSELMLSTTTGVKGVALRAVDPTTGPEVLGALRKLEYGNVADLSDPEGLPGIIVGKELANRLNLVLGSRVNLLAPSGMHSAAGYNPRIKGFRVVGIFAINLYEYDSSLAFMSLQNARDILGMPPDVISGIEVTVSDIYQAKNILEHVIDRLGPEFRASSWIDMNANLFAALKLEKVAMSIILTLIILVGSFPIITALVMVVMEKKQDIAILMSMGATPQEIRIIFMLQGTIIGVMGTTLGFIVGLGGCALLQNYRFIQLPPNIYPLDYLPVLINWTDLAATGVCAMILCFLATLYPSRQAANVEPVTALRAE